MDQAKYCTLEFGFHKSAQESHTWLEATHWLSSCSVAHKAAILPFCLSCFLLGLPAHHYPLLLVSWGEGGPRKCIRNFKNIKFFVGNIEYNVLDVSLNAGGHTRSARAGSLYYNLHPSRVPNMARLLHSNLWTMTNLSQSATGRLYELAPCSSFSLKQ